MPTDSATTIPTWAAPLADMWQRAWRARQADLPGVGRRAAYGASALFALLTIYTSTNALYQVWGRMALLAVRLRRAGLGGAGLGRAPRPAAQPGRALTKRQHRRAWLARIVIAVCVFAGALAIPLGFEILWRFDGVAGSHQQPEVVTVEVGGQDLVHGQEPYHPLVGCPTRSSTTRPASRTSPGSCPTCR